ncbi:MAG: acyl-CoA thioesterase [Cytophagaceae bacterium]
MRIHIDLPQNLNFFCEIPLRIGDINYGGHLGNDSILSIVHESRVLYLKSLGYEELKFGGVGLIMADSAIIYKSEAFYPETLQIRIGVADLSGVGFDLIYSITAKSSGKEIARAKTGMVCFDYSSKKVARLPDEVKVQMESCA